MFYFALLICLFRYQSKIMREKWERRITFSLSQNIFFYFVVVYIKNIKIILSTYVTVEHYWYWTRVVLQFSIMMGSYSEL